MTNSEKARQLSELFGKIVTARQVSKAVSGRGQLLGRISALKGGTEEEQKLAHTAFVIVGARG